MATRKAKQRRFRCRYPGCRTTRSWTSPQAVLAHRVKEHGDLWPTDHRRGNGKLKANPAEAIPTKSAEAIPTKSAERGQRHRAKKTEALAVYLKMLSAIPTQDLMSEIHRRLED